MSRTDYMIKAIKGDRRMEFQGVPFEGTLLGIERVFTSLDHVKLPESATLEECWKALGFEQHQAPWGDGTTRYWWEPVGIYRRLAAGLLSIGRRGTSESEFQEVSR